MQASRILILVLHRFCAGSTCKELSIDCNEDKVAGRISRFNLYAQEGYVGLCERGIGNWICFRFPPGVDFKSNKLQTICGNMIKRGHVVPPTGFHPDLSRINQLLLLKTTVCALLTNGNVYGGYDGATSESDESSDERDPLFDQLGRHLNVKFSIGVLWDLDLFKFVTDESWYFVPVLAIRYWGRHLSNNDRCHFRSDAFIDRATCWYVIMLEGMEAYHHYSRDEARVNSERSRSPPFSCEYRENGEDRIENWKYAVSVSMLDRF